MHDDAIIRRDKAKADLEREEKEIYADRKQRELEIQKVRKEAEEKKVQAQLIQRRIVSYYYHWRNTEGDDANTKQPEGINNCMKS